MNKWKQLQTLLDKTYGFDHIKKSSVKKVKEFYDEKSDEYVFHIEYRVVRDMNPEETERQEKEQRYAQKIETRRLLQDINARVVYEQNGTE